MSLLNIIGDKEVWVTGKGGIGKSTTAAALALHFAIDKEWVLAFDVDGYHSLPDALEVPQVGQNRFRIPENRVIPLYDNLALDLDLCLVSPRKIIEQVRENRTTHHENRTYNLPSYFGILHLYDVLDQLGTLVASEDLASLCLMASERRIRQNQTEVLEGRAARFIYDNQSSNATVILLDRANGAVERLRVMKEHKTRWNLGAKTAGWPDLSAFVRDDYVKHIEQYIDGFSSFAKAVRDPSQTTYLIVSGARKTELQETERLISELLETGFPVGAVLVNRVNNRQMSNLYRYSSGVKGVPLYLVSDLPIFETEANVRDKLTEFAAKIEPYSKNCN